MKLCRQYLNHVQESVFMGTITDGKLKELQARLMKLLNPQIDSVMIMKMESLKYCQKICYGLQKTDSEEIKK